MQVYVFTLTSITNNEFDYSSVEGVFENIGDAKRAATASVQAQMMAWNVRPTTFLHINNRMHQIVLTNAEGNVKKLYTIQVKEAE